MKKFINFSLSLLLISAAFISCKNPFNQNSNKKDELAKVSISLTKVNPSSRTISAFNGANDLFPSYFEYKFYLDEAHQNEYVYPFSTINGDSFEFEVAAGTYYVTVSTIQDPYYYKLYGESKIVVVAGETNSFLVPVSIVETDSEGNPITSTVTLGIELSEELGEVEEINVYLRKYFRKFNEVSAERIAIELNNEQTLEAGYYTIEAECSIEGQLYAVIIEDSLLEVGNRDFTDSIKALSVITKYVYYATTDTEANGSGLTPSNPVNFNTLMDYLKESNEKAVVTVFVDDILPVIDTSFIKFFGESNYYNIEIIYSELDYPLFYFDNSSDDANYNTLHIMEDSLFKLNNDTPDYVPTIVFDCEEATAYLYNNATFNAILTDKLDIGFFVPEENIESYIETIPFLTVDTSINEDIIDFMCLYSEIDLLNDIEIKHEHYYAFSKEINETLIGIYAKPATSITVDHPLTVPFSKIKCNYNGQNYNPGDKIYFEKEGLAEFTLVGMEKDDTNWKETALPEDLTYEWSFNGTKVDSSNTSSPIYFDKNVLYVGKASKVPEKYKFNYNGANSVTCITKANGEQKETTFTFKLKNADLYIPYMKKSSDIYKLMISKGKLADYNNKDWVNTSDDVIATTYSSDGAFYYLEDYDSVNLWNSVYYYDANKGGDPKEIGRIPTNSSSFTGIKKAWLSLDEASNKLFILGVYEYTSGASTSFYQIYSFDLSSNEVLGTTLLADSATAPEQEVQAFAVHNERFYIGSIRYDEPSIYVFDDYNLQYHPTLNYLLSKSANRCAFDICDVISYSGTLRIIDFYIYNNNLYTIVRNSGTCSYTPITNTEEYREPVSNSFETRGGILVTPLDNFYAWNTEAKFWTTEANGYSGEISSWEDKYEDGQYNYYPVETWNISSYRPDMPLEGGPQNKLFAPLKLLAVRGKELILSEAGVYILSDNDDTLAEDEKHWKKLKLRYEQGFTVVDLDNLTTSFTKVNKKVDDSCKFSTLMLNLNTNATGSLFECDNNENYE